MEKYELCKRAPYFQKMFENFKESSEEKIRINVRDAKVAYDFIKEGDTYNTARSYTDWIRVELQLEMIACKHFFGIDISEQDITYLPIRAETYPFLIEICEIIGRIDIAYDLIYNNGLKILTSLTFPPISH